jgi:hypothetical protein
MLPLSVSMTACFAPELVTPDGTLELGDSDLSPQAQVIAKSKMGTPSREGLRLALSFRVGEAWILIWCTLISPYEIK